MSKEIPAIGDIAFPVPASEYNNFVPGLTKREYFAGLAMQGYLAGRNNDETESPGRFEKQKVAEQCVDYATALVAALNGERSPL